MFSKTFLAQKLHVFTFFYSSLKITYRGKNFTPHGLMGQDKNIRTNFTPNVLGLTTLKKNWWV
jgi:hypothetical protein